MPASPPGSVAWEQTGSLYTPPGVDAHVRHSVLLARLFECAGASQVFNGAHDPLDSTSGLKLQRSAGEDFDLAASDLLCMLKHKPIFSSACPPTADAASRTEDEDEDSDKGSDDDFQDKNMLNVDPAALNRARDIEQDLEMSVADVLLSLASRAPQTPRAPCSTLASPASLTHACLNCPQSVHHASPAPSVHTACGAATMPPSAAAGAWQDSDRRGGGGGEALHGILALGLGAPFTNHSKLWPHQVLAQAGSSLGEQLGAHRHGKDLCAHTSALQQQQQQQQQQMVRALLIEQAVHQMKAMTAAASYTRSSGWQRHELQGGVTKSTSSYASPGWQRHDLHVLETLPCDSKGVGRTDSAPAFSFVPQQSPTSLLLAQ
jgi:hypothetical protein